MLAVLQSIVGDQAMAYFAIDRVEDLGDRDAAVVNLKRMIQQSLDRGPATTPERSLPSTPSQAPVPPPTTAPEGEVLY